VEWSRSECCDRIVEGLNTECYLFVERKERRRKSRKHWLRLRLKITVMMKTLWVKLIAQYWMGWGGTRGDAVISDHCLVFQWWIHPWYILFVVLMSNGELPCFYCMLCYLVSWSQWCIHGSLSVTKHLTTKFHSSCMSFKFSHDPSHQ